MIKSARIYRMGEEPSERKYWLTRPIVEKFLALEQMRKNFHGDAGI